MPGHIRTLAGSLLLSLVPPFASAAVAPGEPPIARPSSAVEEVFSYPEYVQAYRHWQAGEFSQLVALLKPRAEQGDPLAQFLMGVLHSNGNGVPEDAEQAVHWWRRSAEQGFARAQNELGVALTDGWGVEADARQAIDWYRQAAGQGLPAAQVNLGLMYLNGLGGLRTDEREAVAWFRKAAEQDLGWAQFYLGIAYSRGHGVSADPRRAAEWMRKAAEQDYTEAQNSLGGFYLAGRGVAVDNAQAAYWLARAAASGHEAAGRSLDSLAGRLGRIRPPAGTQILSAPDESADVIRNADGREYAYVLERSRGWMAVYLRNNRTVGHISTRQLR